jgi:hypothetical protein
VLNATLGTTKYCGRDQFPNDSFCDILNLVVPCQVCAGVCVCVCVCVCVHIHVCVTYVCAGVAVVRLYAVQQLVRHHAWVRALRVQCVCCSLSSTSII